MQQCTGDIQSLDGVFESLHLGIASAFHIYLTVLLIKVTLS
jgi:hypothetical protein